MSHVWLLAMSAAACAASAPRSTVVAPVPRSSVGASVPVSNVVFVDASQLNNESGFSLAGIQVTKTSREDEPKIAAAIAAVPEFSANPYSGCHARAELTARALDKEIPGKVFKVWMFSGQLLAPSMQGLIFYTNGQSETNDTPHWGYHVAAAFKNETGITEVVDLLISKTPMTIDEWRSHFNVHGFAVVTELPWKYYLFNQTEVPAKDPKVPKGYRNWYMARNVFNGGMYEYDPKIEGGVASKHEGARDLAADAVATKLANGEFAGCEWKNLLSETIDLKTSIDVTPRPAACVQAGALFDAEVARWRAIGL